MNKKQFLLAATTTSLLLTGCSTTGVIYEGRYAHKDGWHPGTVVAVGKGQEFTDRLVKGCPDAKEVGSYIKI